MSLAILPLIDALGAVEMFGMDNSELLAFVAFGVLGSAMCYSPVIYMGLGLYLREQLEQRRMTSTGMLCVILFLLLTCWFSTLLLASFYVITGCLVGTWVCFACLVALLLRQALKQTT